jgi:hypothetical protein
MGVGQFSIFGAVEEIGWVGFLCGDGCQGLDEMSVVAALDGVF